MELGRFLQVMDNQIAGHVGHHDVVDRQVGLEKLEDLDRRSPHRRYVSS